MPHDIRPALTGISGILVTPYHDVGEVAPKRNVPIIDRALAAGVHMPVVNGSTGEFYALTTDEVCTMVQEVAALVASRAPLPAGVGRGVLDACRLARGLAEGGAVGLIIRQPPDPFVAQCGALDYVRAVSDAGDGLALVLCPHNDAIGTEAIARLCVLPGVVGVTWATANPFRLAEAMAACNPEIVWAGGLAEVWAPPSARGALPRGLINVWPERSMAIHHALGTGDFALARADRRHACLRGYPCRKAERHQRHRRQGSAAGAGTGLRADESAVGLAFERRAARALAGVHARQRLDLGHGTTRDANWSRRMRKAYGGTR